MLKIDKKNHQVQTDMFVLWVKLFKAQSGPSPSTSVSVRLREWTYTE